MKHLFLLISLFILGGCYATTDNLGLGDITQPQELTAPRASGASYEMYSWYNGQDWAYALFETATGISTFTDITSSPDIIVGMENIAQSVKTLPRGTKVYWNLKRIKGFTLPAQDAVDKLTSVAKKSGIQMEVIAWP